MVTTKKDAKEFAKTMDKLEDEAIQKGLDRGPNDLEEQITVLKKRIAELTGISKVHRDLNGELRQEVYNLKMKVHGQVALENKIEGQKRIIEELTEDNHRLAKEIDDYVNRLRRNGQL
tara:strand:- start:259 stop:612 length:354 start_codon:yes stop_codon:yes gene_type:complete